MLSLHTFVFWVLKHVLLVCPSASLCPVLCWAKGLEINYPLKDNQVKAKAVFRLNLTFFCKILFIFALTAAITDHFY